MKLYTLDLCGRKVFKQFTHTNNPIDFYNHGKLNIYSFGLFEHVLFLYKYIKPCKQGGTRHCTEKYTGTQSFESTIYYSSAKRNWVLLLNLE